MGSKIKKAFSKIRIDSIELKVILLAAAIIIFLQILMLSKGQDVVFIDKETGKIDLEPKGNLTKDYIKKKIKNLSAEDKAWLKKEFGYDK